MTENAPQAHLTDQTEVWHVDFHLSYEHDSLSPCYIRCGVARRVPGTHPAEWHEEGIASFEVEPLVIPRAGAPLIGYLLYHLGMIKDWLTVEHVQRELNGTEVVVGSKVGVAVQPHGTEPVYTD